MLSSGRAPGSERAGTPPAFSIAPSTPPARTVPNVDTSHACTVSSWRSAMPRDQLGIGQAREPLGRPGQLPRARDDTVDVAPEAGRQHPDGPADAHSAPDVADRRTHLHPLLRQRDPQVLVVDLLGRPPGHHRRELAQDRHPAVHAVPEHRHRPQQLGRQRLLEPVEHRARVRRPAHRVRRELQRQRRHRPGERLRQVRRGVDGEAWVDPGVELAHDARLPGVDERRPVGRRDVGGDVGAGTRQPPGRTATAHAGATASPTMARATSAGRFRNGECAVSSTTGSTPRRFANRRCSSGLAAASRVHTT